MKYIYKNVIRAEGMKATSQLSTQLYQPVKSMCSVVSERKTWTPAEYRSETVTLHHFIDQQSHILGVLARKHMNYAYNHTPLNKQ